MSANLQAQRAADFGPRGAPDPAVAERIFAPLARLRRWCRLYLAIDGLVRLCIALIAAGLAQLLLDRWLNLELPQRFTINVILTLVWLVVIHRVLVRPLLRPLSDQILAAAVDRAHPQLHDALATAVQFARGQVGTPETNSPQLVQAVIRDASAAAAGVPFLEVLDRRWARQRGLELVGLLGLIGLAFLAMPSTMRTWFLRNWLGHDLRWPQDTTLVPVGFEAGEKRVPRGDELQVVARNDGVVPKAVLLHWSTRSGPRGQESMRLIVGERLWEVSLGAITEDLTFYLAGGDERTREYIVRAVDRPIVVHTTVRITPPAYTGLEPATLEQQTVLEVLAGSALEIKAQLNKPVQTAQFTGSAGPAAPCALVAPDRLRIDWPQPQSGSYAVELVDRDGWTSRRPLRFTIKITPDRPPTVRLRLIEVGEIITPAAELPIELSLADEFGLGAARLLIQRNDDPPLETALDDFRPGQRVLEARLRYALAQLALQPGERLRVWAEAADQDPAGPNLARSEPITLRVLSATDFAAALAERELELRQEFERLISAQRGLKDALERLVPELPTSGEPGGEPAQRLGAIARRQEGQASRILALRAAFAQILGEMRTNRTARAVEERRIEERIVAPLGELGVEGMPAASARIAALRQAMDAERLAKLPADQAELLRQMEAVLANMMELEGYREVLAMLQEIISEQAAVREATIEVLERSVAEILGLENQPEPPRRESPIP